MTTSLGAPAALRFLGATDSVTGSRYLLETGGKRILVDCGLFQGYKNLRDRNRSPFPVDPPSIDAVILSHAHLDHSGYLPALIRDGFRGPVYCTPGTAELCGILLPDSGYLLEEEAQHWRHRGGSKHSNPRPLYTAEDAVRALGSLEKVGFDEELMLPGGAAATFVPAGHILGAAQVSLRVRGVTLHFTGDLGRPHDPLMFPPRPLHHCDVLVTESTYGNRQHQSLDPQTQLSEVVTRVAKRNGVVIIPAFAVGRTETLLLHLYRARHAGTLPDIPIYLNSPMALNAVAIYRRHPEEHRLNSQDLAGMYDLAEPVRTVDESKLLNLRGGPMVIISASGMITGGRILHHIAAYGSDPANAIVLAGFQAAGTRGARLANGERTLRIFGTDVPIRAEVIQMHNLSAHADADEVIAWMRTAKAAPMTTFVTHGEPEASDAMRIRIARELGWNARVPEMGETAEFAVDPDAQST